ncbi:hypothetical protein AVEN_169483-1 [Araneus ventricosus]|uniref:Helitron helicase-like domain-containing protein n=1 Tax=Araneus ventricosus TaxID=182803 RepID=A0A4Y2LKI1_ARAVE|nr:hypothetical protein AVEN_169483-1 [Araneus ventricosus]
MDTEEEPIAKRRRMTKERKARWLARQSQESLDRIRAVDAAAYKRRIEAEIPAQSQARRERYAEAHHLVRNRQSQRIRDEAIHFIEAQVETHNCGPMNIICQFRKSKNFAAERPSEGKFTSSCRKGKIKLEKLSDALSNDFLYPNFLLDLLTYPNNTDYKNFHDNIRSYNSAVSFSSMGTKVVDFSGGGPCVFKVHGQIRHRTSHIQSVNGQAPQYVQLYAIDSTQATKIRVNHPANEQCNLRILDQIDRFFRQHNRLSDTYRMLREVESRVIAESNEAGEDVPVVNMVFRCDRHSDQRRYNAPTASEIAMVFVNSDGEPPFERNVLVYPLNPENPQQPFININILSPNLDPMAYPIFFPYGEPDWQLNWRCESYQ